MQRAGTELAADGRVLDQAASALLNWWTHGGMELATGAGLAALGAVAAIAARARSGSRKQKDSRTRSARAAASVRANAETLALAASDLLWRMKEITRDGPGYYVTPNAPGGDYYVYKRTSTAFRLAAVLGAIRAIDRETHVLSGSPAGSHQSLHRSIQTFSATLADGPPQEYLRAARLCEVWGLPPFAAAQAGDEDFDPHGMHDAARFDAAFRKHLPGVEISDTHALVAALVSLDQETLLDLFRKLAFDLAKFRGEEPPSPATVLESVEDAARALAFREARIFREWQRTIGDRMLSGGALLTLDGFEALLADPATRNTLWMRRLLDLFEGVEISADAKHDARPRQLRRLSEATAQMILVLAHIPEGRRALTKETLTLAKELAATSQ